jgi:hypothetical protein
VKRRPMYIVDRTVNIGEAPRLAQAPADERTA